MNFIEFLNQIGREPSWIENYIQLLLKDNKKIIFQQCDVTDIYNYFALFNLLKECDHHITFISNSSEKSFYNFKIMLDDNKISSSAYKSSNSKITFYNNSCIEFVPLNLITNNTIKSNTILIDVDSFPTKISEYIVFNAINSQTRPEQMFCSIDDMSQTILFEEYFDLIRSKLPIISSHAL